MRRRLLFSLTACAVLTGAALILAVNAGPPNLVQNGDFEQSEGGVPTAWQTVGASVTSASPDGDAAGAIELVNAVGLLFQQLDLETGASYELAGQLVDSDAGVSEVQLRVRYSDGAGASESFSAGALLAPGSWSPTPFSLPCDAATVWIEALVSGTPGGVALVDDLQLKEVPGGPGCATPTPPATETPASTDTPTVVPSATETMTATPTATATPEPSATTGATATAAASVTPTPGATAVTTATATPDAPPTPGPTATEPIYTPTPSRGVVNGGFEVAGAESDPLGWATQGGVLSQVEEPVHGGAHAGAFYSATNSTKWVYQTVAVEPGSWRELSAYIFHNDPWVEAAWLRVSWYSASDGSGSAIDSVDSTAILETLEPAYRLLTTGPVKAPPGAHSARLRIMVRPLSSTAALVVIDDVAFDQAAQPPTPTPAATVTPTSTRTPAPTPVAPPTPTSTLPPPTATLTPLATPPTGTPPVPTPTSAHGATVTPTAADVATPSPDAPPLAPDGTHGLLVNGGFEVVDEDGLAGWRKHGGVLSRVDAPVHGGAYAAAFHSASESTKWVEQAVPVTPVGWYELDGFVLHDDPRVETALLRVAWYESGDGSGQALATLDSTEALDAPAGGYRYLTTGPVQAPPGVHSAKVRILLRPRSAAGAIIYIDDVSLRVASPPPVVAPPADESAAGGGSAGGGGGTGGSGSSAVLGVEQRFEYTPQPTPVLRRDRLAVPVDAPSDGPASPRWPWAVVGLAAATIGASAAWTWRQQRRPAGPQRTVSNRTGAK